jgi:hypothetical protein
MNTGIKPWSNHRQVLWALGVFGLIFLAFVLLMVWLLQGGFGPGKETSPPGLADFFGTVLLSVPCVYYIVVAHLAWTRKLWIIGVVIHSLVLIIILVMAVLAHHGGSFAALPFLLGGPVAWILYAKRNTLSERLG